jgi:tRNA A-37 threonylcarbamoyl transferase component Bud32
VEPLEDEDPRQVGQFEIIARLGSGGMGRVYLARTADGERFALKMIHQFLSEDVQFRRRFEREVIAARQVTGPNTAALVDADPDARPPWMAVEYVDGPTLNELVEDGGALTLASSVRLASGMAQALIDIHGVGLVHRDLKPSNVLMGSSGARLIDFGIAQASDASRLTMAGLVTGSAGFMSPEQAQAEHVTAASDVFALGAVLFFAATGERAFGDGSMIAVAYRVVHGEPDLSAIRDEGLRELIGECLLKNPRLRPTPDEILARCPGIADGTWREYQPTPAAAARSAEAATAVAAATALTQVGQPRAVGVNTAGHALITPPGEQGAPYGQPAAYGQPGQYAPGQYAAGQYGSGGYGPYGPPSGPISGQYSNPISGPISSPVSGPVSGPISGSMATSRADARRHQAPESWFAGFRRRHPTGWLLLPVGALLVVMAGAAVATQMSNAGNGTDNTTISTVTDAPAGPGDQGSAPSTGGAVLEGSAPTDAYGHPRYTSSATPTTKPTGKPTATPTVTKSGGGVTATLKPTKGSTTTAPASTTTGGAGTTTPPVDTTTSTTPPDETTSAAPTSDDPVVP